MKKKSTRKQPDAFYINRKKYSNMPAQKQRAGRKACL